MSYIPTTQLFVTIDGHPSRYDGVSVPDTETYSAITCLRRSLKDSNPFRAVWVGFKHDLSIRHWQDINGNFIKRTSSERCTIANIKYEDSVDSGRLMDEHFQNEDYGMYDD